MNSSKLSVREKIGYGMGDAGCNIIFGAIMLFVNYFYTDIFGLARHSLAYYCSLYGLSMPSLTLLWGPLPTAPKANMVVFAPGYCGLPSPTRYSAS